MRIKSKLNGEISNVRGDIAREMVKLGVAEIIGESPAEVAARLPKPGDAVTPEPRWSVEVVGLETKHLAIQMLIGVQNNQTLYIGHPDSVNARKEWPGGGRYLNGFGRAVPDEIAREYKRQWKASESLRAPLPDPRERCEENERTAIDRRTPRGGPR
jgi:hypothetical protein